jgi:hypothetical protein
LIPAQEGLAIAQTNNNTTAIFANTANLSILTSPPVLEVLTSQKVGVISQRLPKSYMNTYWGEPTKIPQLFEKLLEVFLRAREDSILAILAKSP